MIEIDTKYKKIFKYINAMNLSEIEEKLKNYLQSGSNLSNDNFEKLLKMIKFKDHDNFIIELLKIIDDDNFASNKKSSSNLRVKKYRNNLKQKGYKNLSLNLSEDDYKKLKILKIKKQMTYSQIISFLLNQ